MPYIDKNSKKRLQEDREPPISAGQLTFLLQQQIQRYLRCRAGSTGSLRYEDLAVCLGALDGARLDLIERVIKPYEAVKLAQNGDVWDESLIAHAEERPA